MERKFYTDGFEQLLKEKSDEFRMYPSKRVWHSIYNDLHPGRKWPSFAISVLSIIALLMVGYWNSSSPEKEIVSATNLPVNSEKGIASNSTISQNSNPLASGEIQNDLQPVIIPKNNIVTQPEVNTGISIPRVVNINNSKKINSVSIITHDKNLIKADAVSAIIPLEKGVVIALASAVINLKNKRTVNAASDLTIKNTDIETSNTTDIIVKQTSDEVTNVTVTNSVTDKENSAVGKKEDTPLNTNSIPAKKIILTEDKAWMEDYAFHNKSKRKKWQDRTALEFYITPNVGYRKLTNDSKHNIPASTSDADLNSLVNQKSGFGFEAGLGITYSVAKNLRLKIGLQANYTNYGINADETNHPILTTLVFIDPISGFPYMHSSSSTLSNSSGLQPVKVHNKTYQASLPVGFALKLYGNNKLEWYAGAAIQPTFVIGGKAYLISADRKNYVANASLIRKWNLNAGFETYINYKFDGFTLQAGPQFRYQLLSTYYKKYSVKENLYNMGLKIGIIKNF